MHTNTFAGMPALMTTKELAGLLRKSARTIHNRLSEGTFPIAPLREGSRLLFRREDVAAYLEQLAADRPAAATAPEPAADVVSIDKPRTGKSCSH